MCEGHQNVSKDCPMPSFYLSPRPQRKRRFARKTGLGPGGAHGPLGALGRPWPTWGPRDPQRNPGSKEDNEDPWDRPILEPSRVPLDDVGGQGFPDRNNRLRRRPEGESERTPSEDRQKGAAECSNESYTPHDPRRRVTDACPGPFIADSAERPGPASLGFLARRRCSRRWGSRSRCRSTVG